jgi:hypothetical protein
MYLMYFNLFDDHFYVIIVVILTNENFINKFYK